MAEPELPSWTHPPQHVLCSACLRYSPYSPETIVRGDFGNGDGKLAPGKTCCGCGVWVVVYALETGDRMYRECHHE